MGKYEDYYSQTDFAVPGTMQALVASGSGFENLAVKQVPVPKIGPNQLLARVDAAGVCTSILKLIDQGEKHTFINGWDMKKWPVVLGDEGAVTLVKIGDNLRDKYQVGQRYAIQPAVDVDPILHRDRHNNNAEDMHKCAVGYTLGGHLAQYIRVQEEVLQGQCLLPLPDDDMPYFAVSSLRGQTSTIDNRLDCRLICVMIRTCRESCEFNTREPSTTSRFVETGVSASSLLSPTESGCCGAWRRVRICMRSGFTLSVR